MRVGVHTSIAGALANAAHRAHAIGCDGFQMFSANPRGWRALPPAAAACEAFREARAGLALAPVAIHANYLINLASPEPVMRARSVTAFRAEARPGSRNSTASSLVRSFSVRSFPELGVRNIPSSWG